ncbi:MAG: ABC transporter ATP-binding protein [Nitrospirae bacterium]|nr:ABC transporter ATP-binding protein [Nitrospirota bacterium]
MIRLERLRKVFPKESLLSSLGHADTEGQEVLREITMEIGPGECVALLGPNGSGKSTLLRILATLLRPTSGQGQIGGYHLVQEAPAVRRLVGCAFGGGRSFYLRLTGRQNLAFFAALHRLQGSAARMRMEALLAELGLREEADRPARFYSTGMLQRLDLARALLCDPPVLLLDEPTQGLDPAAAEAFLALLKGPLIAGRGKTVLLATHRLEEAEALCRRVAILSQGTLRMFDAPGAPGDHHPEHPLRQTYFNLLREPTRA